MNIKLLPVLSYKCWLIHLNEKQPAGFVYL